MTYESIAKSTSLKREIKRLSSCVIDTGKMRCYHRENYDNLLSFEGQCLHPPKKKKKTVILNDVISGDTIHI